MTPEDLTREDMELLAAGMTRAQLAKEVERCQFNEAAGLLEEAAEIIEQAKAMLPSADVVTWPAFEVGQAERATRKALAQCEQHRDAIGAALDHERILSEQRRQAAIGKALAAQ